MPEVKLDVNDQIDAFKDFFDDIYKAELYSAVMAGRKSLSVDFTKLAVHNPDLSEMLVDNPEDIVKAAELAVETFDLPKPTKHFRIRFFNLPPSQKLKIADIRSEHLGKFIWIESLVRQSSDIRPQVTNAKFECAGCGNTISILQIDSKFKEPSRCTCGWRGKFRLLSKDLVDVQHLKVEEVPEALEGGEQPKRLSIFLKEDLVEARMEKRTAPGARIMIQGIVKEFPILLKTGAQSTRYDIVMEANNVVPVQEDFTDIKLHESDIVAIKEFAKDPFVYEKFTKSIAPSIYGHEKIKEALVLQLMGGVRKVKGDGTITRGDIHILLIGDPGAGKCLAGNSKIILANGQIVKISDFVNLNSDKVIDGGFECSKFEVPSINLDGKTYLSGSNIVWKRKSDATLLKVKTQSGSEITVTKNHPFFVTNNGLIFSIPAENLTVGTYVATPRKINVNTSIQRIEVDFEKSRAHNGVNISVPEIFDSKMARFFGYLIAEGWIKLSRKGSMITFTNNDEFLINDFVNCLKSLNVNYTIRSSHIGKSAKEVYSCSIELARFIEAIEPSLLLRSKAKKIPAIVMKSPDNILAEFLTAYFDSEGSVDINHRSIEASSASKELIEELKILLLRFGIVARTSRMLKCASNTADKIVRPYYRLVISGKDVERFYNTIGFNLEDKQKKLETIVYSSKEYNTNVDVLPNLSNILKELRAEYGLTQKSFPIPRSSYQHYERGDRMPSREQLLEILKAFPISDVRVLALNKFATSDIFWDRIVSVSEIETTEEFVYDIQVDNSHNYIANSILVHNSQILSFIAKAAPKARFVSGKGSSGAGLTAAVVKDEFLRGWSLEAGALVLANKGLVCVDELDKMTDEDRSALHEALEQQTITISKANIQATLRAETTMLAAANPKLSRFDPYAPIASQIDLPSTLINRFDLIFPIRDIPNKEKDERIALHVLEAIHKQDTYATEVTPEFLRKYLAYVKTTVNPEMSAGAINEIKNFYVTLRNSGQENSEGAKAIPVSARQLEALIRLAQASARVRLAETVTKEDARKAIELLKYCLLQVGVDPETGQIDIDRMTTGISASTRNRIVVVKEILEQLAKSGMEKIPIEEVVNQAVARGLDHHKVEEVIDQMKRSGEIYEPTAGFIKKV